MPTFVYVLVISFSLLLSLYFSTIDMALTVCDVEKLEDIYNHKKTYRNKISLKLAKDYGFSISSILFGNNLANISASSFAVILGTRLEQNNGGFIATLILTIFVIIFCEFIPKAFAQRFSYKLLNLLAVPCYYFQLLFFPLVFPISKVFKLINRPLQKKREEEDEVDDDVLQEMVDTIEDEGIIEEDEADLLRSTINLNDIEVYEIMTPRVDTYMLDIEDDIYEMIKKPEFFDYSRIPVYEGTVDNIIGILPLKGLLKRLLKKEDINVKKIMYKPLFVPRNTLVLDLLSDFKKAGIHIAIIIDEHGGTEGIITMEDILELIVGDIFDEDDDIEEEVTIQNDGTMIIDGSMYLEDFFDLIEYKKDFETSYTTVGGFCQEFINGFGKKGDSFVFFDYQFEVIEASEFSIEKIKIAKLKKEEEL